MREYDYIIVGAGPCGLTLAHNFKKIGKKILLIDRENDVGGIHRVRRVDGLYTEHGPKIYFNNYFSLISIMKDMGMEFHDYFTPYKFTIFNDIIRELMRKIHTFEIAAIVYEFIKFTFTSRYGQNTTVLEFMNKYNFTTPTKKIIDEVCRLSDGASSKRFTLYEFFQIFNQNIFYTIYQPITPNDVGLFKVWKEKLLSCDTFGSEGGECDILLNTEVTKLNFDDNIITGVSTNKNNVCVCDKVILAIPPEHHLSILSNSGIDENKLKEFKDFEEKSRYITYIPIMIHLQKDINFDKIGLTNSEWGLIYIALSDYMNFTSPPFSQSHSSKTVISTAISKLDVISNYTQKTANDSTLTELKEEVLRQLIQVYPKIERKDVKLIVSPGVYKGNRGWKTKDSAFIFTKKGFIPNTFLGIKNVWTVGTHNGNSNYDFTSMESAIQNANTLFYKLSNTHVHKLPSPFSVTDVIYIIILVIIVYYLLRSRVQVK